jgi:hypothetical protein
VAQKGSPVAILSSSYRVPIIEQFCPLCKSIINIPVKGLTFCFIKNLTKYTKLKLMPIYSILHKRYLFIPVF